MSAIIHKLRIRDMKNLHSFTSMWNIRMKGSTERKRYTDPVHNPMIPYTVLLEPGLKIFKVYNGYWYWGRPTPDELRQDFRAISIKCRPDWDLANPEVKEKWEKGEKDFFYPY